MSDKKEKVVDLDELASEDTTFSLPSTPKTSKTIDLNELENEEKAVKAPDSFGQSKTNEKIRHKKVFGENEKKAQKNWLLKKVEIGPKKLNTMYLVKGVIPLFFAYNCWQFRYDMLTRTFNGDELSQFVFRMTTEPLANTMYGLTIILSIISIYFLSLDSLKIFDETSFLLSSDGIEGVDTVIPITTKFLRRKIRWNQIEGIKVNELAKVPHLSLINKEKVIIELPLYIANLEDLKHGVKEFCPDDCPFRLFVNKFKKS